MVMPAQSPLLFSEYEGSAKILLTDIDDTLTTDGKLGPQAYQSLWDLADRGMKVIPVTGRPAGWCEMIARQWPVAGVVGENGAFYFRHFGKRMHRWYATTEPERMQAQTKLHLIRDEILKDVPGSQVASDQFARIYDLAIDFCEDVPPLSKSEIKKIVDIFTSHGATAKVSSIHVNGWFGIFNKLETSLQMLEQEFSISKHQALEECIFVGDSPNDEPMFEFFPNSFGVANVQEFLPQMKFHPKYIATEKGGEGFTQISRRISQFL